MPKASPPPLSCFSLSIRADRLVCLQTVNQARIENQSPNSKRPSGLDERVLPDLKANIKNADSESRQRAKFRKLAAR